MIQCCLCVLWSCWLYSVNVYLFKLPFIYLIINIKHFPVGHLLKSWGPSTGDRDLNFVNAQIIGPALVIFLLYPSWQNKYLNLSHCFISNQISYNKEPKLQVNCCQWQPVSLQVIQMQSYSRKPQKNRLLIVTFRTSDFKYQPLNGGPSPIKQGDVWSMTPCISLVRVHYTRYGRHQ